MWPRDGGGGGDSRRPRAKDAVAVGKGAGARWQLTAVERLRTHVMSKGAFGMLAVGRYE